jgi:hypothetical protein
MRFAGMQWQYMKWLYEKLRQIGFVTGGRAVVSGIVSRCLAICRIGRDATKELAKQSNHFSHDYV